MKNQKKGQPTYFRTDFQRKNIIKMWFFAIIGSICSYPRLIIEVFIRSHMGERYCAPMSMICLGLILALLPWTPVFNSYHTDSWLGVIADNKCWYLFVAAYAIFAAKRWNELRRDPSVFDFKRYSVSTGYVLPFFNRFTDSHGQVNFRLIEIWLEPIFILIIGFICSLIDPNLGKLLMLCAIIYSISYMATYNMGDHAIMNIIDKGIMNEELEGVIVNGNGPENARGVRIHAKRPGTEELRRRLLDNMKDDKKDDDDDGSSVAV